MSRQTRNQRIKEKYFSDAKKSCCRISRLKRFLRCVCVRERVCSRKSGWSLGEEEQVACTGVGGTAAKRATEVVNVLRWFFSLSC